VAQEQDADEFDAFYRAHVGDVRAYCLRRADPTLAEDAVAETFAIAWRRRAEITNQPRGWLLGVARRVLANRRRADRRQANVAARLAEQPLADAAHNADAPPVLDALSRLAPGDQEVLMLAAWEELSSREAARVLGCSPVAARLRLHRARRRLAQSLSEIEDSPSEGSSGVVVRAKESRS
jgi:RNA polymerase sigma factor (sigma-70 family)